MIINKHPRTTFTENFQISIKFHTLKRESVVKYLGILIEQSLNSSSSSFEGYPLQVRHKQDWGRGFILLLHQAVVLPESDAGSDVIKPESSFFIQNHQTSCSMWCPMYRARC